MPVLRIARMAGQFAKPRSSPTEIIGGKEIPSFRGEIINGIDPEDREPDPNRLTLYGPSPEKTTDGQGILPLCRDIELPSWLALKWLRFPAFSPRMVLRPRSLVLSPQRVLRNSDLSPRLSRLYGPHWR